MLLLGWPLLGLRPTAAALACGALGVVGVAVLVLGPAATLNPLGLAAAAGATTSMGVATVLARRWGPPPMPLLAFTAWQLMLGGAMIVPSPWSPKAPRRRRRQRTSRASRSSASWVRHWPSRCGSVESRALPAASVAFLGLLSPIVATAIGWAALGQSLTSLQLAGAVLVGASIVAGRRAAAIAPPRRRPLETRPLPSEG